MHNRAEPNSKWVATSWNNQWGVWSEEGPVGGKHICDADEEEARIIAMYRNHFDELMNFIKVSKNYRVEAMDYAKSAIRMCKDEITRGVYQKAFDRMADAEKYFERALKKIEKV